MERIDLSTNSKKIQESYDKVVRGDSTYVVYSVDKNSTLQVDEVGQGDLNEFVENFNDGNIQFGLARVTVPGSDVSKNILLGWCPDNSPSKLRLSFAANFADVAKILSGYHVQITARDQDDLDVDEFLNRVGAAAGARYSYSTNAPSKAGGEQKSKPVVAKPSVSAKPSYVPRSTGKPTTPAAPKPKLPTPSSNYDSKPKTSNADDGWGGEKEIEERDFTKNPLSNTPSSYKPTKVNIDELRKQKSDTTSSTPKPFQQKEAETNDSNDSEPKSLSERMATFKSNESDGRMTSLPKPKVSNSVSSRFTPVSSTGNVPKFGAKPIIGNKPERSNDGLVGGLSRNFGAEGGKTPAQLWAEKRGQYKVVKLEDDDRDLSNDFESKVTLDDKDGDELVKPSEYKQHEEEEEDEEEEQPKPSFVTPSFPKNEDGPKSTPARNLPPPPVRQVPAVAKEELSTEEKQNSEPEAEDDEEDATSAPSLPARNEQAPVRSLPTRAEEPTPSLPAKSNEPEKAGISATAEYDYEKDDDNEIGFEEGDKIVEIDFVDKEWWAGKHVKSGEVGLFPAAYVVLDDKETKSEQQRVEEPTPAASTSNAESKGGVEATAEFDYEKDEDNEIAFVEGDLIVEIEFIDDDWWSGKHAKSGEVGLFPANYVKLND